MYVLYLTGLVFATVKESPMTGSLISPTGRSMDNKCLKKNMPQELSRKPAKIDHIPYHDNSPAKKKKAPCSNTATSDSSGLFDGALASANKEMNVLFSQYSQALSERAAGDASQVRQLEDILMEARGLEAHLKEKKDNLRRTLALISDKLQG
ncbi:testis-expressed protein 12-like [Osmerus mordax]|uniref:testis-expressed protein 12-like n=1 Tax=Osmerus mordax TaxID=8014 RepID=UPI00350F30E3